MQTGAEDVKQGEEPSCDIWDISGFKSKRIRLVGGLT